MLQCCATINLKDDIVQCESIYARKILRNFSSKTGTAQKLTPQKITATISIGTIKNLNKRLFITFLKILLTEDGTPIFLRGYLRKIFDESFGL